MRRPSIDIRFVIVAAAAAVVLAGCARPGLDGEPTSGTSTSTHPAASTTTGVGSTSGTGTESTSGGTEPTAQTQTQTYKVTYDWAVPSTQVSVTHQLSIPLPGPIGLPYLVGIYSGDHPEADPAYQRISFYFRGGFPSYKLQYVRSVLSEGTGDPVAVPGNAVLRVGFVDAQAHDANGASTIAEKPATSIGFSTLKGYGFAGDFEGHVTFALGIQVAPGGDQALPIRAGELTKGDGSGGTFFVVHVDVRKA